MAFTCVSDQAAHICRVAYGGAHASYPIAFKEGGQSRDHHLRAHAHVIFAAGAGPCSVR